MNKFNSPHGFKTTPRRHQPALEICDLQVPDHLRQLFLDAIDAFRGWDDDEPDEPKVEDGRRKWTLSEACGKVWNYTDILPYINREILGLCGIELDCYTYATAARTLLARIKEELKERDGRLMHHHELHGDGDPALMFAFEKPRKE